MPREGRRVSTQEAEDESVNGELVMAEPMPVEQAVHWKPLRDAHYILASLQPADGGRRHIVVRQHVLAVVQRRMRGAHGRQVGILLGRFYQCPTTSRNYEVIESFLECSGEGVDDLFSAIATGLEAAKQERGAHVLGWYCSAPTLGPRLGGSLAAIHSTYFQNPWQTTLVVTGGASAPDGVFFLHDDAAARSFYAPFYELPEHGTELRGAKATCIAWSQYLTVEPVILVPVDELLATSSDPHASPAAPPGERSVVSTAAPDDRTPEPPATEPPPPVHPLETGISGLLTQLDAVSNDAPRLTSDIREETVRAPAPDRPAELPVERNADTIDGTPVEKTPMPEERRQWLTALRRAVRRPKSTEGSARDK